MKPIFIAIAFIFFSSWAQAQSPAQAETFTKSFYDWYVQKDKNRNTDDVLKYKKEILVPELYKALKADSDAQAKVPDELVGLDFDPFLNAQDFAQKYQVGKALLKGNNYWVDVYGLWNGKKKKKPDLKAEVACSATACQFVNFHYDHDVPGNENLMQILQALKKERDQKK